MSELLITAGPPSKVKDFIGPRGIIFMPVIGKRPVGRPTVMTSEVLQKLEYAFTHDLSDKKACVYADISLQTLYNYEATHPEFVERKAELRLRPDITAKILLVERIENDLDQARWWAMHRMDEFTPKSKIEHAGEINTQPIPLTPEVRKVVDKFNTDLREAIASVHKKA